MPSQTFMTVFSIATLAFISTSLFGIWLTLVFFTSYTIGFLIARLTTIDHNKKASLKRAEALHRQ